MNEYIASAVCADDNFLPSKAVKVELSFSADSPEQALVFFGAWMKTHSLRAVGGEKVTQKEEVEACK